MTGRGFIRGSAGRERVAKEAERIKLRQEQREKQSNKPFRYWLRPDTEDREFVVLDEAPDFFVYEHTLQDPITGKWGFNVTCCRDFDTCAVCESSNPDLKDSSYNMVLTVLDLEPYTRKDGTQIEFSRKLLVVKPAQHRKFLKQFERGGKLRGAVFTTSRGGPKTSSIGDDIQFEEYISEEDLKTYVRTWKDREGKTQTEDCSAPFVYEEVFDEADPEELRRLAGAAPVDGSQQANAATPTLSRKEREAPPKYVNDDEDNVFEEDDDDLPFDPDEAEEAPEVKAEAPRTTRRRAVTSAPEEEAPPPATRRKLVRRSRASGSTE